tara:strand:+ start:192 stop:677 length:486 start_codon:yes stop_codon:yes gene_type:complete
MAKKKKSKLKKFLKRALPVAALAAGAGLLAQRRRNQANVEMDLPKSSLGSFADARAKMTTNDAMRGRSSIYPDAIMRGIGGARIPKDLPITSANVQRGLVEPPLSLNRLRAMDTTGTAADMAGEAAMFKSGGKVVKTGEEPKKRKKKIGIQVRGFGKARRG